MSEWRDEINRKALARLEKALPEVFPPPVLIHAMGRRFTPPMPRLAIDSYWRAHPVRADRLARACGKERCAGGMDMAACRREARSRQTARPQNQGGEIGLADVELPGSAGTLQRKPLCAWARLLLHLRPASLPVRLACGLMGSWREPECSLARRLRGRLGTCGRRRAIMRASSSTYSNGAAPGPVGGCGEPPRSITGFRCSGCGASTATCSGHHCSASGAYRTYRSSIATCI